MVVIKDPTQAAYAILSRQGCTPDVAAMAQMLVVVYESFLKKYPEEESMEKACKLVLKFMAFSQR